ncbi:SRPBCC family protein [Desulfovibrio sp. DV]|uniref:SRPBCC family protein n=1 Tax=Desulfovibrio sp. DV TaxID=1844708 RepID=UPI00094BA5B7|nr:SRPBCC family protein [Desulfovibrio sp. DV]
MVQFDLVTLWRIGSGLTEVWDAITRPVAWPQWWRGLEVAEELDRGGADGIGSKQRFVWKGALPYRLMTELTISRIEPLVMIQGEASGDVTGTGIWRFAFEDGITVVRHEWRVRATAPRLKFLASVARPLVCWNHGRIMAWGAQGLARHLGATFVRVERRARA